MGAAELGRATTVELVVTVIAALRALIEDPGMAARLAASAHACVLETMPPSNTLVGERGLAYDLLAHMSWPRP